MSVMSDLGTKIGGEFKAHRQRIETLESGKVDKVTGKQLSTEDYTTAEKTKLTGIESGAQVNTVTSVAGKTGSVSLTKSDVGLSNLVNSDTTNATNIVSGTLDPARLATSGVTAGDYTKVTVDAKGRVTAGSIPTTLAGYNIGDAYTKSDIDTVNLLRADKFLASQSMVNMIYTNGDLTKIRYNNDTDVNYEVLNYTNGDLTSINHYVNSVLKGTTTLSYTNGNLVSSIFVGV